jgi:hypothetical protein
MKEENRITNIDDMGRWPGDKCYIKPKNFSPELLEKKVREINEKFYSYSSILSRLAIPVTKARIASWIVNFDQRNVLKEGSMESFDAY